MTFYYFRYFTRFNANITIQTKLLKTFNSHFCTHPVSMYMPANWICSSDLDLEDEALPPENTASLSSGGWACFLRTVSLLCPVIRVWTGTRARSAAGDDASFIFLTSFEVEELQDAGDAADAAAELQRDFTGRTGGLWTWRWCWFGGLWFRHCKIVKGDVFELLVVNISSSDDVFVSRHRAGSLARWKL